MQSKKVAVIDHDKKYAEDLGRILAASGHEPMVVNDPLMAVDEVAQKKPDVVIVELKMPYKNGFELADEINQALEGEAIPIIAMSEFFKEEFGFLLNICGIKGYLKKPFTPLEVIWTIENVTQERRRLGEVKV